MKVSVRVTKVITQESEFEVELNDIESIEDAESYILEALEDPDHSEHEKIVKDFEEDAGHDECYEIESCDEIEDSYED